MAIAVGFTINGGQPYTNDSNVTLQIYSNSADEILVTNDLSNTQNLDWEAYTPGQTLEKDWVLGQQNSEAEVFVKFRQNNTDFPKEAKDSIIHDNEAPLINQFTNLGTLQTWHNTSETGFEVYYF